MCGASKTGTHYRVSFTCDVFVETFFVYEVAPVTIARAGVDPLCPYGYEFKVHKNDVERLKNLIEKLIEPRIKSAC